MNLKVLQKKFQFIQKNTANIKDVFPLLCPTREHEWLEGWEATIIHSYSGHIEQDCVFTTPHHGSQETIWQVTKYDPRNYKIEFVRVTPNESIVKINIQLSEIDENSCASEICYLYTFLNPQDYSFLECELEQEFTQAMLWWEKAMNHYLATGKMLRKEVLMAV